MLKSKKLLFSKKKNRKRVIKFKDYKRFKKNNQKLFSVMLNFERKVSILPEIKPVNLDGPKGEIYYFDH